MTKNDFLGEFMGNQARGQILKVFMFNPNESFALPLLAKRAGVSPQTAAREARTLEEWGVVKRGKTMSITIGNTKRVVQGKQRVDTWIVDAGSKYFRALSSFVHEVSPVRYDAIVGALKRSGKVAALILSGSFMGDDTRPADLIVALDSLNERRVEAAIKTLEPSFGREIRYAAFSTPEFRYRMTVQDRLMRETLDFPHLILLDRTRLL
jgi:hypothetical protein